MSHREDVAKCRAAARALEALRRDGRLPGCLSVGIGFKYKGGKRTDEIAVIIGVAKKLSRDELESRGLEAVPASVDGVSTDVIEDGEYRALVAPDIAPPSDAGVQSLTERRRPTPGGFSCGHPRITAGTLGAWMKRGSEPSKVILSNNHVLANSNDASPDDFIWQPGPADGGGDSDAIARLEEFVRIRFGDGSDDNGAKKNSAIAQLWWGLWTTLANVPASLLGCPYRAVVVDPRKRPAIAEGIVSQSLDQPFPNLVDAALARQSGGNVADESIFRIGRPSGFRDLQLGDLVEKSGRTTGHTVGIVERVESTASVSYGSEGIAEFEDQFIIREVDGGEFSSGGDSGSVLIVDGMIGGLLFAGGGGITIANRISHVVSLLGIRV